MKCSQSSLVSGSMYGFHGLFDRISVPVLPAAHSPTFGCCRQTCLLGVLVSLLHQENVSWGNGFKKSWGSISREAVLRAEGIVATFQLNSSRWNSYSTYNQVMILIPLLSLVFDVSNCRIHHGNLYCAVGFYSFFVIYNGWMNHTKKYFP